MCIRDSTSTARHALYRGFVTEAVAQEAEALGVDGAAASAADVPLDVTHAKLLRQLLAVLPAVAEAAEVSAVVTAARRSLNQEYTAVEVGTRLGLTAAQQLKVERQLVAA